MKSFSIYCKMKKELGEDDIMEELYKKLKDYQDEDYYPFHMPGHKRNMGEMCNPYQIDITEITGFDDLHHAEGILKECQDRAAALYGAEETHFLINGSTGGILSAISGSVRRRGKIAVARNCHKSVYHGILLNELEVCYLYPEYLEEWGINGGILPEDVENLLKWETNIQAVVITSPTYEGIVSDVETIAKIVHSKNIPLIVDEAHGAHFYFHDKFPKGALQCGADIVINSVHKTLPAFTQTALLHMQGTLVDREQVRKYLGIYQTSSPSYILMSGISQCINVMEQQGEALLEQLYQYLDDFYKINEKLTKIAVATDFIKEYNSVCDFDISKLVISTKNTNITGRELQERLNRIYHLELEMSSLTHCLAMTSVGDTKEGLKRLAGALLELDETLKEKQNTIILWNEKLSGRAVYKIAQAEELPQEQIPIEACCNRISAEFVYMYPPGIPMLCPGELITKEIYLRLKAYREAGITFQGLKDEKSEKIKVITEE